MKKWRGLLSDESPRAFCWLVLCSCGGFLYETVYDLSGEVDLLVGVFDFLHSQTVFISSLVLVVLLVIISLVLFLIGVLPIEVVSF